jgi:hypothetical protein
MVLPCRDDSADRQIRFEARPAEDVTHRRLAQVRNKRRFPSGFTCNIRRIGGHPCPPASEAATGDSLPGRSPAKMAGAEHERNRNGGIRAKSGRRGRSVGRTGVSRATSARRKPRDRDATRIAARSKAELLTGPTHRLFRGLHLGRCVRPWCESAPGPFASAGPSRL